MAYYREIIVTHSRDPENEDEDILEGFMGRICKMFF
jgi:hypothetical protein